MISVYLLLDCVRGARLGRARRDAVRLTSGTPTLPVRWLSKGVAVASLCCPSPFPQPSHNH